MSPEQVTLLAQLLTLGGVAISIGWGTLQHHWTESANKAALALSQKQRDADAVTIGQDRRDAADKLESDRILLAAELDQRRLQSAKDVQDALELRATEIRANLELQANDIRSHQEELLRRMELITSSLRDNTVLTKDAVETAKAAYHEANSVNLKIAQLNQVAIENQQADAPVIQSIADTGLDTNIRVRKIEGNSGGTD